MSNVPEEAAAEPLAFTPTLPQRPADPNAAFGVVGFVLSLFLILNIAGLVVSIVALVRSRRAGFRNRFAQAGVVIGGIGVLTTVVVVGLMLGAIVGVAQMCAELGDGVHHVGNATYTCGPGSAYVNY